MDILAVDIESYFDNDYTLKKLTTESYIRHPLFKAHMVGVRHGNGQYFAHRPDVLRTPTFRKTIETSAVLCHHAQFDGFILAHHYDLRPALWLDTLSMARLVLPRARSHSLAKLAEHFGLPSKLVPYELFRGVRYLPEPIFNAVADGCLRDVELTWRLLEILGPYVPREELRVIDMTIRMFTEPTLGLDRARLKAFLDAEVAEKARRVEASGLTVSELQSSAKFALALETIGYECPMKPSPTGNGYIPALAKTDDAMREMLDHDDPRLQALAAARLGVKSTLNETRAEALLGMDTRGPLPVYLTYCGAHTTRWSGGDKLNWQNFPRGGEIRKSIKAPKGHMFVIADASQIECRLTAWLAGEQWVLDAFAEKRDLYSETAGHFYHRPVTREDKAERGLGKLLELSCGYGSGAITIMMTAKRGTYGPPIFLTLQEADEAKHVYRSTHKQIVALWKKADHWLRVLAAGGKLSYKCLEIDDGLIYLPNGTTLDYGGLSWQQEWVLATRRGSTRLWGSKLVENIVQALARVILSQVMVRLQPRLGRPVLTVHDELVWAVPSQAAQTALETALAELRRAPLWAPGLPLDAEGLVSEVYSK